MEKIINVSEKIGKDSFYSREDINNLISSLPAEEKSVLDFKGVDFLGPSPAHEVLVALKTKKIGLINLSEKLKFVLNSQNEVRKVGLDLNNFFN